MPVRSVMRVKRLLAMWQLMLEFILLRRKFNAHIKHKIIAFWSVVPIGHSSLSTLGSPRGCDANKVILLYYSNANTGYLCSQVRLDVRKRIHVSLLLQYISIYCCCVALHNEFLLSSVVRIICHVIWILCVLILSD